MPSTHGSEKESSRLDAPRVRGPDVSRPPLRPRSVLSAPEELVLRLVRRDATERVTAERLRSLDDPAFRSAFQAVITGHGIIGLVLTSLRRCDAFGSLSRDVQSELLAPLRPFAIQATLWDAERDRLLQILRDRSLLPIVLKGGALRLTVYDDPAERLSGDLDLLVSPHRVRDGLEGLAAAGYVNHWTAEAHDEHLRYGYHLSLAHANGFEVELHWDLAPRGEGFRFDPAAFLNRSILHERPGADPVRVPCPEHMVLHLADQNREDSFSRLKRLVDIDRVIRASRDSGLDWEYLVAQAREGGHSTVVSLALRLASRLLDTPVPRHVADDLDVSRIARVHISLLRPEAFLVTQQAYRSALAKRTLHFWLVTGWRGRTRWARRVLDGSTNPLARLYSARRGRVISQSLHSKTKRAYALARLAAYHGLLYLSAFGDRLRASGAHPHSRSRRISASSESRLSSRLEKGTPWTSPANTIS